ncbi:hypothetical protein [Streptacidiphilus sp. MAP12-16]|uniref:hypothetical protein n=1 Tax=Streptacidiphilus sp. MAP12-16 TaxID=3156300 RepID=UPI003519047B
MLFTFALVVVVGYWLLVLAGGIGHGGHHAGGGTGGHGGHGHGHGGHGHGGRGHGGQGRHGGLRNVLGLGGVPITVAVSLLIAFTWFSSLSIGVLLHGRYGGVVLPAALLGGWSGARLLVWPLRRIMPAPGPPPSRLDFVGSGCVIRTGRVGPDFGQAEVRAKDGSASLVQVRQSGDEAAGVGRTLTKGATALIYAYDAEGEFFRVMPDLPGLR